MPLTPEQNAVELELIRRHEKKVSEQGEDPDLWEDNFVGCDNCGDSTGTLINGLCFQCDDDLYS